LVEIVEKKLIQLSNTLVVTMPNKEFIQKWNLKKGDVVNMIYMKNVLLIADKNIDFNSDEIKAELDEAQENWNRKEKEDQFAWITRLSQKEQNEIKEPYEATEKLAEEYEEVTGQTWDLSLPHWDLQPQGKHLSKKELLLRHLAEQKKLLQAHKEIQEVTSTDPNQKSKSKQKSE